MENYRGVVARGVPSDDGNSGPHNSDATIRVSRAGVGPRVFLLDGDGDCDFLLVLSHVSGARSLRKRRSPPHPLPRACCRHLR